MIESQDKYKELVGDEPTEPVDAPPTDQVQEPVQQTNDEGVKNQVKVLSDIAFEKGLDAAIEEAKKLNNPYILDEFHDTLVDELYKKLVEAGKLEQK